MLFTLLTLSCLVMVNFAFAQSIPKPSVPEFTLKFTDNSYDVPPRYDFDPYTGKDVIMEPGYHVQEKIVEVIIKNQPFTSYTDANGNVISLYYSIRIKGSFGDYWWYPDNSAYERVDDEGEIVNYKRADLDSDYTLFKYCLVGNNGTRASQHLDISDDGAKADFQVQAFIGYMTCVDGPGVPVIPVYDPTITPHHFVFTGEEGDWSDTQTITIPASQMQSPEPTISPEATLTPTPYLEPQQIGQDVILGVAVTVAVLAVGLGLLSYLIKRK